LRAGEAHLHGADVSASFRFRSRWRLLGDLSLHSGSFAGTHLKQTNFMAGARPLFSPPRPRQPFAQGVLGGAHSPSTLEGAGGGPWPWERPTACRRPGRPGARAITSSCTGAPGGTAIPASRSAWPIASRASAARGEGLELGQRALPLALVVVAPPVQEARAE